MCILFFLLQIQFLDGVVVQLKMVFLLNFIIIFLKAKKAAAARCICWWLKNIVLNFLLGSQTNKKTLLWIAIVDWSISPEWLSSPMFSWNSFLVVIIMDDCSVDKGGRGGIQKKDREVGHFRLGASLCKHYQPDWECGSYLKKFLEHFFFPSIDDLGTTTHKIIVFSRMNDAVF